MATTHKATYKQFNGTDWDTFYFKTSAGQVGEGDTLYFLRPATHTVNGKKFYNGSHQGITLYAEDITLNASSEITIKGQLDTYDQEIANIEDTINKLDYASSDHNHDSTYLKLSSGGTVTGPTIFQSTVDIVGDLDMNSGSLYLKKLRLPTASGGSTYGLGSSGQVLKTNGSTVYWAADNNTTYLAATQTSPGLMSAADKKNLDTLVALVEADTNDTIDKINEVFALFEGMDDETTIITELNKKVNCDNVLDSTDISTVADLSSYDANYIISAPALINALDYYAANDHDHDSTYLKLSSGGTVTGPTIFQSTVDIVGDLDMNSGSLYLKKLQLPTASGGSTYGLGSSGQVLKTNGSTVYWAADNNTTYLAATQTSQGLMSAADKVRLDDIHDVYTGSTTPTRPKSGDIWLEY